MAEPAPPSGRVEGGVHVFPVRVYYEDTDAGGIVYHANYLRWAERARTEMMRLLGAEHSRMAAEEGAIFAVRRCSMEFDRPARLDDLLEVRSRVVSVRGASLDLEQVVSGDIGGAPARAGAMVRVSLTLCCLNRDGRPVRLPASVGRTLRALAPPGDGDRD